MPEEPQDLIILQNRCAFCRRPRTVDDILEKLLNGQLICKQCKEERQASIPIMDATHQERASGTLYEKLGVSESATVDEITAAFAEKIRPLLIIQSLPPEEKERAILQRTEIEKSYQVLIHPESREKYDIRLHKIQEQQLEIFRKKFRPPLDFWGTRVETVSEIVTHCDASQQGWNVGLQVLGTSVEDSTLLNACTFGLEITSPRDILVDVLSHRNTSSFHKLNEVLYRFDPQRPFHLFFDTESYNTVPEDRLLREVEDFAKFAEQHWDLMVKHLYSGELVLWLHLRDAQGIYGPKHMNVQDFYTSFCVSLADTPVHSNIGLEMLIEFLHEHIQHPKVEISVKNAMKLDWWDGEIPHRPVQIEIRNVTRGYWAGRLDLMQTKKRLQRSKYLWIRFQETPDANPALTSAPKKISGPEIVLSGKTLTSVLLPLDHFRDIQWGRQYSRNLVVSQMVPDIQNSYDTLGRIQGTIFKERIISPISLRLMRFRDGYRAKLWNLGLRGNLPGFLLNGLTGFLCGFIVFILGLLFAPHQYWGFLPPNHDFTGSFNWSIVIDGTLVTLLRPFYIASIFLGFELPLLLGIWYGLFGMFTGLGKGHTDFTKQQDRIRHTRATVGISWTLWIIGIFSPIGYWNYLVISYLPFSESIRMHYSYIAYTPPEILSVVVILAVIFTGMIATFAGRVIRNIRQRLYDMVYEKNKELLQPEEHA